MNNFGILFVITLVIVGLAILLLGVQTFFSKRKRFPNTHVGGNKAMAKKGIFCVQTQDAMERRNLQPRRNNTKEVNEKENIEKLN